MALQLRDRVLETASAPGTGTVTLLGASLGYQSFNTALTSGSTTYYTIADLGGANFLLTSMRVRRSDLPVMTGSNF